MYNQQQLINLLLIICGLLLLTIILFLFKRMGNLKQELRLKEYEINISSDTSDEVMGLLDKIIQECFLEYTVLNVEYKEITYIDAELEKEIAQQVSYKVIERLSPTLLSKISLVYNIDNLSTLLSERSYLHVLNYSIERNTINK